MKKIKNKKSSPIQIKTPQSQITTLWNSLVSTMLMGFFFFFVFFFLFLFLPQIGLSVSSPPFFPFLLSFFFFFLFLPLSWCLAFLNSLYLLILLKPKPKPICLKLLSQINGFSLWHFFFWWVSVHMVLSTCHGEVEGVGLWGSVWWRSEFMGRHGWGCGFVVIGVCGGVLVMAHIRVWVGRWCVAWLFSGWIEVWWWVSVAKIGV